ncbi:MAG: hypothetical protein AABO58_25540 [Acidobacteriota bacterium]
MVTAEGTLTLIHDAAAALTANGWRVSLAAVHSGGTADVAADRAWSRGKLSARLRLIVRCDSRPQRLLLSSVDAPATDRLPSYCLADDDPAQRRAIAAVIDPALIDRLHAAAYPHAIAVTEAAHLDALPAHARAAAVRDAAIDEAFASVDAVRRDLLRHDLDVVRDDLEIDRDFAAGAVLEAAHRLELLHPMVITDGELWSLPDKTRRDWIRLERSSLVGRERQWLDLVEGRAFAAYAGALTRHITAAFRKRRFATAVASSRS